LQNNKIFTEPNFHKGEVHFKVFTRDIGESFLEILGHKFEGVKYKLEIHAADYKNEPQK